MAHKTIRAAAAALVLLLGLAGTASAHGLIQDPPARNWFCGAITKPDHVANGVAQYPVCGDAFFAPGIELTAGYSFMSVLTHTQGYAVLGPRAARVQLQLRDLERRRRRCGTSRSTGRPRP